MEAGVGAMEFGLRWPATIDDKEGGHSLLISQQLARGLDAGPRLWREKKPAMPETFCCGFCYAAVSD